MIRDEHLKRYILCSYNKYINKELKAITCLIFNNLSKKFIINEKVLFTKEAMFGNIIRRSKDKYSILLENRLIVDNAQYENIKRAEYITTEMIFSFLLNVTCDTPFGIKLLKRQIFDELIPIKTVVRDNRRTNYIRSRLFNTKSKLLTEVKMSSEFEIKAKKENKTNTRDLKKGLIIDYEKIRNLKKKTAPNLTPDEIMKLNKNVLYMISNEETFKIEDLNGNLIEKLFKIFSFIKNFCDEKISSNLTITKLVKLLRETTYNSDVIGDVHEMLIDNLKMEIEKNGFVRLMDNIKSVVDSLPDEEIFEEIKRKNDIGLKTWKIKTRSFLWDLQMKTQNKTIYSYYSMLSKKKAFDLNEALRVRIYILEFLISCYFTTNMFRDIILLELKDLERLEAQSVELEKNLKLNEESINRVEDVELKSKLCLTRDNLKRELHNVKRSIIYNPTKAEIGTINQVKFTFIDEKIYASKGKKFYILKQETLDRIASYYVPTDKIEGLALAYLKNVIEIVYD